MKFMPLPFLFGILLGGIVLHVCLGQEDAEIRPPEKRAVVVMPLPMEPATTLDGFRIHGRGQPLPQFLVFDGQKLIIFVVKNGEAFPTYCRDIAKDLKLIEPRLSLPEIEAQRRREESAQKLKQQPDRKVLQ